MMECPTCKRRVAAGTDRLCRRCGTDVGALLDIESEALMAVREAERALRDGDEERARAHAERVLFIDPRHADGIRCAALAALSRRDFASAVEMHARHCRIVGNAGADGQGGFKKPPDTHGTRLVVTPSGVSPERADWENKTALADG